MKDKAKFIEALAEYLVGNEIEMSIRLQMGKPDAKLWSKVRNASPLFGYYGGSEGMAKAIKELTEWLG
jgi:hypothetical protein